MEALPVRRDASSHPVERVNDHGDRVGHSLADRPALTGAVGEGEDLWLAATLTHEERALTVGESTASESRLEPRQEWRV